MKSRCEQALPRVINKLGNNPVVGTFPQIKFLGLGL